MNTTQKFLTDRNGKKVQEGSIVRVGEGWMEVRSVWKGSQSVNLGPIHHAPVVTKKHVPIVEVYEDQEAWYSSWTKSETYMSM